MADISGIDIPTMATAILTLIVTIGGVLGKTYIGKALSGITTAACGMSEVAGVLVAVGQLMITISKAGEDNNLTPEEWTTIKEQARAIQADLLVLQGKLSAFKL